MCQDENSDISDCSRRYEAELYNAHYKWRPFLDDAVKLQRREQKTGALEKNGYYETALQKYSLTIQKAMLASLSLTNRMRSEDRYSIFYR